MSQLHQLPARPGRGLVHVVVESPRGCSSKLKYDPALGAFTLSRPLVQGLTYPHDWGFVPGTRAADGDPLDAMVIHDAMTYPGVVLPCRAIGVLEVSQYRVKGKPGPRERNDRILAVPRSSPRHDDLRDVHDLPARTRHELAEFFLMAVALEHKGVKIGRWAGPREADALIEQSRLAPPAPPRRRG